MCRRSSGANATGAGNLVISALTVNGQWTSARLNTAGKFMPTYGRIEGRIRLPFAIPFIFSGLKMAITFSVIGAVVGEFVAADRGLGYLMTSALAFFNTPLGYGAITILSLLAIILFQAVVVLERVLFPWSTRMRT